MAIKSRIFNIAQNEYHPETKEPLLNEETIKSALLGHKMIKRWAYIRHDKDVYSVSDEEKNPNHKKGNLKPPHWHIVIELTTKQLEVSVIAKWLKIPESYVGIAKGAGAFLDCVKYLTHEDEKQQEMGKTFYPDEEVKANFDFRAALSKRALQKAMYGRELSIKDELRYRVLYEGLTLSNVINEYPIEYQNDMITLQRFRLEYISRIAKAPDKRINIYVEGQGGIGKGLISRALAKAIINQNPEYDDDVFFEVGSDRATFEGYDGQPVIIWNDCRASTLLDKLGGRENVFNVFDTFPPEIKQNIKYSSVRLNNEINIINSVEPYKDFIKALSGNEDRNQALRRIPLFIVVHEEDYDLNVNKGVFEGTREYEQFLAYNGIKANFRQMKDVCGANTVLFDDLSSKSLNIVVENYNQIEQKLIHDQRYTDEEIKEMFKDVGTQSGKETIEAEESKLYYTNFLY
jgi:hypothetical protein